MAKKKIKIIEANVKNSALIKRIKNFSLRFNVEVLRNGKEQFRNRCITAIARYIGDCPADINQASREIFYLLGISYTSTSMYDFSNSVLYKVLIDEKMNIKNDYSLYRWLMIIECMLNIGFFDGYRKVSFAKEIAESLKVSGINAVLCESSEEYLFYPANAEILDQKLVVDTLNWLSAYPKVKEQYNKALRTYLSKDQSRHVIDNLRLAIELFFKQLFSNSISLENQKKEIGEYLKRNKVSVEIRNMYVKLLDCFAIYNNQHIKHNDHSVTIKDSEIEYLIYLTGTFLRFIIQLETEKVIE